MTARPLKIAVVAGEVSGDLLGGDLIAALRRQYDGPVELVGVGGEALTGEGLVSLFDYSELSIMGFTQVIARLPRMISLIRKTADAIIAARPDVLLIIDSPDFTHRVAKRVRKALPDLPVVKYVCPSVWAWKEYRARAMLSYVDHVLAVLPFEPEVMKRLGGPPTTFIGHRLASDPSLLRARTARAARGAVPVGSTRTIMLLPGSRGFEIGKLLPLMGEAVMELVARNGDLRFVLPTVARREALVREIVANWPVRPEVVVGDEGKWRAFAEADAAVAASGTVVLELALAGVPSISVYKTDWIVKMLASRIKIWTAALPNLIADYPVVPEYIDHTLRPGSVTRWMERLSVESLQRKAMLEGFERVQQRLTPEVPAGEAGAGIVLDLLKSRGF
ncbi:lipid-A-disaccharide synthase [Rhizobiaceae bacterium BDR2-2]|uniref:Lipid-A-disaccharide synthase n=1 Tax=Ectorhizobium quercum TaxID=2965071 RepID=A0AAE3N0W1_9HYPH|nr:lipid-A-disaccharide synthase [Ectorhizobium quercum]MCX8997634.1 lipid-A-disaccharide synthase [Ectorhizobium quercum]